MDKKDLQKQLDLNKWYLSESKQSDLCGSFDYCAYCKRTGNTPCADAWLLMANGNEEQKVEEEVAAATELAVYDDYEDDFEEEPSVGRKRKVVKTFTQKFNEAPELLKERYFEIVKEFLSYRDVKSRVSKRCDTYRISHAMIGRIFITGNSLKINLPLDVAKYSEYPHSDSSDQKSLADTPFRFKIASNLGVKRAKKLIAEVAEQQGLTKRKYKKEADNKFIKN